jgi:hypothetical protein
VSGGNFAGIFVLILFLFGGVISTQAGGLVGWLGGAVAIGAVLWYFATGHALSGWVGPDREDIEARLEQLHKALASGAHPDGRVLSPNERDRLYREQTAKLEQLRQYDQVHKRR